MSAHHLVLIGLMGSGKSAVGRSCAHALAYQFVDTDVAVEQSCAMTVAEIFAKCGEAEFRKREATAVAAAAGATLPSVISCGGGVPLDPANCAVLRDSGFVVWLDARVDVLQRRVGDGMTRPLLRDADTATVLSHMAHQRGSAYRRCAHTSVDTSEMTIEAVSTEVVRRFTEEIAHAS